MMLFLQNQGKSKPSNQAISIQILNQKSCIKGGQGMGENKQIDETESYPNAAGTAAATQVVSFAASDSPVSAHLIIHRHC